MLNGKAVFPTRCSKKGVLGQHTQADLFTFAESVVRKLRDKTNEAYLYEGISRIDFFTVEGKLYVNEVENLDAEFSSTLENEANTKRFLISYYITTLSQIMNNLI